MSLLFFLPLVVTFPSLYVFNALVGSRLIVVSAVRLLIAMLALLGPIVVFLALSTPNYEFMQLLNVAAGTVGGVLGLAFLLPKLHRLILVQDLADEDTVHSSDDLEEFPDPAGALDPVGRYTSVKARTIVCIWVVLFALVGAQMSWILRPFIGHPDLPYQWFRQRESNFFLAVLEAIRSLFS